MKGEPWSLKCLLLYENLFMVSNVIIFQMEVEFCNFYIIYSDTFESLNEQSLPFFSVRRKRENVALIVLSKLV